MSENNAVENRDQIKPRKKQSQLNQVWKRFRKSPSGLIGLFIIFVLIFTAVFADVISPPVMDPFLQEYVPAYRAQNLANRFAFPSRDNFFGTDNFGRCIFDRIVHGARLSLYIGFLSIGISLIFGTIIGLAAGYYAGVVDNILMRFTDIMLAIPGILLAMTIVAALGGGLRNLVIAIGLSNIPVFARQVSSSVLSIREQEFIEAAKSIGASDIRIMFRHILPNCMAPIIIRITMGMAIAILSAAALSFIGLGIEPPLPEWGSMLSAGRAFIRDHSPSVIFPGLAIALVVFGFNLLGDGLRDALDPRLKR
jgi:peptide/nickel transport system permease protein